MPYGYFTNDRHWFVLSKKRTDQDYSSVYGRDESDRTLSRSGSNHGYLAPSNSSFSAFRFTKAGDSVRMYLGVQRIPVRKYRWVGSGRNRQRQFFIVYKEKHIWQKVPLPQVSYRNISPKTDYKIHLLRPNPLLTVSDDRILPESFTFSGRNSFTSELYDTQGAGYCAGNMAPGSNASSLNGGRLPFTLVDWEPPTSLLNELSDKSLRKLYEKVASKFPDVGTMIGESKESIGMMRDLLNKGADLVGDLLKRDKARLLGRLKTTSQEISSAWLTYVYGIKPIISDIASIREYASDVGIRTYVASSKLEDVKFEPYQTYDGMSVFIDNFKYDLTVKYGVIMRADLDGAGTWDSLNLSNPASVGYNLIPFSFMVDWLYDAGSFLKNHSALQYGYLTGWKTVVLRKHWISYQSPHGVPIGGFSYANPGYYIPYTRKYTNVNRKVLAFSEFPALPAPKFDPGFSAIRGLNTLAILVANHKTFKGL